MIDWCMQCADVGCFRTKHKDLKHRMFAYVFVRIVKDALLQCSENTFFKRVPSKDNHKDIYILDEKFYNEYVLYEVVGYITENIWLKKSYWSFMRHMIADSRTDVNLWRDYKFNVNVFENGEVRFEFTKKM